MLDNIKLLYRFLSVVENGTLHAAADALGVSQPALTRSLKMLEADVGEAVFERRGRGLTLTPLGVILAEQAKHLLREQQLAEAELITFRSGARGNLRIGAASIWMVELLPKVIAQVHATYPSLQITISSMNYSEGVARLKDGSIDAFFGGFQTMESLPSYLIRKALFVAHLVLIARKGHPILKLQTADTKELTNHNWLSFQSDDAYFNLIGDVIHEATGVKLQVTAQCNSMLTALELLRRGDYLAFLPSSILVGAGGVELSIVETEFPDVQFDSGPIYRRSLQQNVAFMALLAHAIHAVKEAKLLVPERMR